MARSKLRLANSGCTSKSRHSLPSADHSYVTQDWDCHKVHSHVLHLVFPLARFLASRIPCSRFDLTLVRRVQSASRQAQGSIIPIAEGSQAWYDWDMIVGLCREVKPYRPTAPVTTLNIVALHLFGFSLSTNPFLPGVRQIFGEFGPPIHGLRPSSGGHPPPGAAWRACSACRR